MVVKIIGNQDNSWRVDPAVTHKFKVGTYCQVITKSIDGPYYYCKNDNEYSWVGLKDFVFLTKKT
tara:strand:- start:308 stop:502 length:195 start_codon:yes stop_codon:yes gene_type:complete